MQQFAVMITSVIYHVVDIWERMPLDIYVWLSDPNTVCRCTAFNAENSCT